jgi:uncharacterized repeat protein (TIGR01451 family)
VIKAVLGIPSRRRLFLAALVLGAPLLLAILGLLAVRGPGQRAAAASADPADLSVSKSDSPDPVSTGAILTYTIKVHDAGPDAATGTSVTDALPGGVKFGSVTTSAGTCTHSGSKVTCDLGTVSTTADQTITLKVTVTKKSGQITNSASVTSGVADDRQSNNIDTEVTTIAKPPAPPTCAGQPVTRAGTPGPDTIVGTPANDVISALAGDDSVFGLEGGDIVCLGPGSDSVSGGAGNDLVLGGHGSDRIRGRRGDDRLHGGPGRDRLRGGRGDDLLAGGR